MNCEDADLLLCDYLDGTLDAPAQAAMDAHVAACPACAELVSGMRSTLQLMERAERIEVPPALVTRIVHETTSGKHGSLKTRPAWLERLRSLIEPVLQPRFAMSMALTILSFSMLGRFAGLEMRQFRPADLTPSAVWQAVDYRAHRVWDRAAHYYDNIRLVYEIRTRVSEWAEEDQRKPAAQASGAPQRDQEAQR